VNTYSVAIVIKSIFLKLKLNFMPRIKKNTLIKGASGAYQDEFVYKQRGGKTHIAGMPTKDKNREPTALQEAVIDRFSSASAYAVAAVADPELKKFYQSKVSDGNTAFNVAFRDFQRKPKVKEIFTDDYTGVIGSEIGVNAKDDCKVTDVTVRIVSAAGVLIEEGNAILRKGRWYYATTQNNPVLAGTKITATAKDLPENRASLDKTL
jgi:hypothetical protein